MEDENADKLRLILLAIILVAVAGVAFGLPQHIVSWMTQWLISIFIGMVFSLVASSLIEALTGDLLKRYRMEIEITDDIRFSISLFMIATVIVKYLLFHQL